MIPSIANIRKAIYCLNKRLDLLEGGEYSSTVTELSNKVAALESLLDDDALNPTAAIDKFNEIVAFLDSINNTETLLELLRDVILLSYQQNYVTVSTYANLPTTGSADTIYRVSNYNGSTNQIDTTSYSEYVWDNSDYTLLCVKSLMSEVFDISAYYATGGTLAKFADLTAALDSNNGGGVPQSLQKGGMSIKFVQSSDNKYEEYFLTKDEWSASEADWQKMNLEEEVSQLGQEFDNTIYGEENITVGKRIDTSNGNLIDDENFGTSPFIEVDPSVGFTFIYGVGASNVLAQEYKADKSVQSGWYWQYATGAGRTVPAYNPSNPNSTMKPDTKYVRFCFLLSSKESAKLTAGGIDLWKYDAGNGVITRISELEEQVQEIIDTPAQIAKTERIPEYTTSVGYVQYNSNIFKITPLSGFLHTSPIRLKAGETITMVANGYASQVCMIALCQFNGILIQPIHNSIGDAVETVSYTAKGDEYVILSWLTLTSIKITTINDGEIGGIVNGIDDVTPIAFSNRLSGLFENPIKEIKRIAGFTSIIRSWGFIGDSLSSGYMNYDGGTVTMYDYSWGQMLCRITGADGYNFSYGGQYAKRWVTALNEGGVTKINPERCWDGAKENPKDAYIIALGENDISVDIREIYTEGSVSTDVGTYDPVTDTDTNANSYAGWMAGIIQRIRSIRPKAPIFLVTLPKNPATTKRENYNTVIRDLAALFDNCYLIDLYEYAMDFYYGPNFRSNYFNSTHMNALGYQWVAWLFCTYIDWIIRNNFDAFRNQQFVGTEYIYND